MPLSLIPTFFVMKLAGLLAEHRDAAGADPGGRHAGRRRDRRDREHRAPHARSRQAAPTRRRSRAPTRSACAVVATTLAIVAVFVPVGLHARHSRPVLPPVRPDGRVAVAFSLVVARLLTPLLGAYLLKPGRAARRQRRRCRRSLLLALLRCCLRHRLATIAAGVALLWRVDGARAVRSVATSSPASDRGRTSIAIELAPGATLADTEAAARRPRASCRRDRRSPPSWPRSALPALAAPRSGAGQHHQARRSTDGQPDRDPGAARGARHEPAGVRGRGPAGA